MKLRILDYEKHFERLVSALLLVRHIILRSQQWIMPRRLNFARYVFMP
jgi:hypothetical protein